MPARQQPESQTITTCEPVTINTRPPASNIEIDIAIIGGGIAGLWLHNRLRSGGYRTLLFEHRGLGSDQTIASQGMIHGGIKYTLGAALSGASEAIADMPEHWRRCMAGQGDVDLRGAQVLSDHFYLWSAGAASTRLTAFLASKATRGRVDKVAKTTLPPLLNSPQFKGSVYRLVDMVLDVPGVLRLLAEQSMEDIYLLDWQQAELVKNPTTGDTGLILYPGGEKFNVACKAVVLTAGNGNASLLQAAGATGPAMQRRPLQQIMVKHTLAHRFYGHCLGNGSTPRLTISSHPCEDGAQVWYLGGAIAEKGVDTRPADLIELAKRELAALLPWITLPDAQWATLPIDRAEPRQRTLVRPDQAYAQWADNCRNVIAAWPTKLTLVPNLANSVLALLQERGIAPNNATSRATLNPLPLAKPPLAMPPWQVIFGGSSR